jgi:hypothetical protein
MLRHLDGWARRGLASPEGWASSLERCAAWADYSPRNQILLASYGVVGPVAGSGSWAMLASTEMGRMCAVRTGEHGLLVRVPVLDTAGVASDRSRTGGQSGSVASGLRWEPVFALEQLARRPASGLLHEVVVPSLNQRDRVEAVRVATGRVLGRTPRKIDDPVEQLAVLASRISHGSGRLRLSNELAAQAAWLVADRLGWSSAPMQPFDPSGLSARERWRTAVDVRHAVGQVLVGVSHAVGVDLVASVVPRHDLVDDRNVAPGRRNYLSPADVRGLPLGVWVEAGPCTRGEWLARGVAGGVGVGAFLRVNDRSYLAAYETRSGATWRLETTGRGAHHGLVAEGTADTLIEAKDAARAALIDRFPDVARSVDASITGATVPQHGWVPVDGGRGEFRVFDDRVSAIVAPGPGGRWQAWATVDATPRQGPLAADVDAAKVTAESLARGALLELATFTPDRANALVLDMATSGTWDRSQLISIVGARLSDTDRAELASTADAARLGTLMHSTGVLAPSTTLLVLHAEGHSVAHAVDVVSASGMPVQDAIRLIHREWDADRLEVGALLGASAEELRSAGCTPIEMLAVAPREELRRLDTRESTWDTVGPLLLEAGYSVAEAVGQLAAHAPTPETFAVGVASIVESPLDAFTFSTGRAVGDDLSALGERYGLSVDDTARIVSSLSVAAVSVEAVALPGVELVGVGVDL